MYQMLSTRCIDRFLLLRMEIPSKLLGSTNFVRYKKQLSCVLLLNLCAAVACETAAIIKSRCLVSRSCSVLYGLLHVMYPFFVF